MLRIVSDTSDILTDFGSDFYGYLRPNINLDRIRNMFEGEEGMIYGILSGI